MSYDPTIDFLGLLRQTSGGVSTARMPGLDYVVSAMARAGLFRLSVGQTPPLVNQANTVWLKPSLPSWVAEGVVYLWNALTGAYELATPSLWALTLSAGGYSFQAVATASGVIAPGTSLLAIQRAAPNITALVLPALGAQWITGRPVKIVDWSSAVTNHAITITPPDGSTIMRRTSWTLLSSADQLAGVTLTPAPDLNGWVITP